MNSLFEIKNSFPRCAWRSFFIFVSDLGVLRFVWTEEDGAVM